MVCRSDRKSLMLAAADPIACSLDDDIHVTLKSPCTDPYECNTIAMHRIEISLNLEYET